MRLRAAVERKIHACNGLRMARVCLLSAIGDVQSRLAFAEHVELIANPSVTLLSPSLEVLLTVQLKALD
jgi:hypothetical protein